MEEAKAKLDDFEELVERDDKLYFVDSFTSDKSYIITIYPILTCTCDEFSLFYFFYQSFFTIL